MLMSFLLDLLKDFSKEQILHFFKDNWGIIIGYMFCGYLVSQWMGLIGNALCLYFILQKAFPKNKKELFLKMEETNNKVLDKIEETNKIEGKILISQFIINIDDDKQELKVGAFIHNCSNQIIDIEIDAARTRAIVNTTTHLELSLPPLSMPPYGRADLVIPTISLSSYSDDKEITITASVKVNYGSYKENKKFSTSDSITTCIQKINKEGKIEYRPKN